MSERKVTAKQGKYLAFIHDYTLLHGRPPAETEIAQHVGVSPPLVHQMVVRLKDRGFIAHTPGQARSIRVLVPRNELPPVAGETASAGLNGAAPVATLDGRAELAIRAACRVVSKMFDHYEAKGMDDSELAPFIRCVADAVAEELHDAGISMPESTGARARIVNHAVETYVKACAEHDPDGPDAEEDAERFFQLMRGSNGRP